MPYGASSALNNSSLFYYHSNNGRAGHSKSSECGFFENENIIFKQREIFYACWIEVEYTVLGVT